MDHYWCSTRTMFGVLQEQTCHLFFPFLLPGNRESALPIPTLSTL